MSKRFIRVLSLLIALVLLATAGAAAAADQRNFRSHLTGGNEVPPVSSQGQGQAIFQVSKDGGSMSYRLIVANIDNVTQAHIHCGGAGVNGPVVAFLFGFNPAGVTVNGVLAEGTLTAANVIPRPDSAACPGGVADFDDLLEKMRTGGAYVNVHTLQHAPGEIRGQIE